MIRQMWRLSEAGSDNLGLACTDDGLLLGRTPLVEHRDGRFVVRERGDIERLLKRAYQTEPPVDRLMPGLATVAAALNANDACLAQIAAVHLRLPDLPSRNARSDLEAEDILIKSVDWNSALHPRTGTPPNPGWFAPSAVRWRKVGRLARKIRSHHWSRVKPRNTEGEHDGSPTSRHRSRKGACTGFRYRAHSD